MKILALALTALTLSIGAASADSAVPTRLSLAPLPLGVPTSVHQANAIPAVPALSLAPLPGTNTRSSSLPASASDFAQLGTQNRSMPISSGMVLALIAVFVLALRLMSVQHARAMADNERHSYDGKAQMFRALQDERSSR